jgi:hypothetical protein
VLCLGTDLLSEDQIKRIIEIFLSTAFASGRHERRLAKVKQIEDESRGVPARLPLAMTQEDGEAGAQGVA